MEEGYNEIKELKEMIELCFERQNRLISKLEMELEALSNFNGKQMLDSRDMRLQLKVCDRTLIRWRRSGKLPFFKISGKVYFWAFDVYKFLREEYGTANLPTDTFVK
ncbi:helix-turn-helix domain-containing protein [Phocaeicola vulgatus]|uniref:helix-turn-helix domain-containing protein n=1 Tax=Phocaeicola vulgatus TaxID=821 RepID=UPI00189ED750|nr:helix-turn-helix domain-containing protein [Phocaeicola vulgatus]MDB1018542.1 helix-turn-helix domain-containing protein [Phocaeicola vulgatus]